jgi:hypothetical protein
MHNQTESGCNNKANLSWTAVFSGVLISTAVGALVALLGSAIGISLFKPDTDVLGLLSIGAVVWFIITGCFAMFVGGWATGYITPYVSCLKSSLHGFVLWSISFLLGMMLSFSSAGLFLTGSAQLMGKALSLSQEIVTNAAKPITKTISTSMNLVANESFQGISDQLSSLMKKAKKHANKKGIDTILQNKSYSQMLCMSE